MGAAIHSRGPRFHLHAAGQRADRTRAVTLNPALMSSACGSHSWLLWRGDVVRGPFKTLREAMGAAEE